MTAQLSVVLVSLGPAEALRGALEALEACCRGIACEVLVPAPPRVGMMGLAAGSARFIDLPASDDDPWVMRAAGARQAQAPIVATLEDHAIPSPDWAHKVLQAHTAPHAAIGGCIAKSTPDSSTGWAMYFLDYGRYIPPQLPGFRKHLSACNVTYKRAALLDVATSWERDMHETTVHFALAERGHRLWLDPALVVSTRRLQTFSEATQELRRHGRLYGADVARTTIGPSRWSRRLLSPLIPIAQFARAATHLGRAPRLTPAFVRALPSLIALCVAWGAGEAEGLWSTPR